MVPVQAQSADGYLFFETPVRSVPIIAMRPGWKLVASLRGGLIGDPIGPFPEGGLYEALGLAVGSRGVESGTDMADVEFGTEISEDPGSVARSMVGHNAFNGDPEVLIVGDGGLEKGDCASGGLVGHHSGESHAGIVVDADVQVFPSCAPASVHAGVPFGDSMPGGLEAPQLLDVDVDHLAGSAALVATRRREGVDILDPAQPEAAESATDGGRSDAKFGGDPLAGPSLALQGFDPANEVFRSRLAQLVRPGGSVPQTGDTFCAEACDPFCGGLRADAEGCGRSLWHLPVLHHAAHPHGSTMRCQSGPNGQPVGRSHLGDVPLGKVHSR